MRQLPLLIDLSRIIKRYLKGLLPTGIDRVIIAYLIHYNETARGFIGLKCHYIVFSKKISIELFQLLINSESATQKLLFLLSKGGCFSYFEKNIHGSILLNLNHQGLDKSSYCKLLKRLNLQPIYLLHDVIPLKFPEYCRVNEDNKHQRRMETILTTAKGVITNSKDTLNELKEYAEKYHYTLPPIIVAELSVSISLQKQLNKKTSPPYNQPYFLMLSTIEPRKNHWLILQIWKELYNELGDNTPKLVLIGRRGWESENVFALLDRSIALKNTVTEINKCDDIQLARHLNHAQALILPSFAEGYGLPLIEALLFNTPVISSDLSVFKEILGDIPEYIPPLDGIAWKHMIIEYSTMASKKRALQMQRLKTFNVPTWEKHFFQVNAFMDKLFL